MRKFIFYLLILAEDQIEEDEGGDDDGDYISDDIERVNEIKENKKKTEKSNEPVKPDSTKRKNSFSSKQRTHLQDYGKTEIEICLFLSF